MKAAIVDRQAEMAALVHAHQTGVWRYLRYLGCCPIEADDLTQETFLVVFRDGFEERSPQQTAAYLRTVARNRLLMIRRKDRKLLSVADLDTAEAVWAETLDDGDMSDYVVALEDCLEKVTPRVRQVLDMLYRDRISRAEIANRLEMAFEGVKTLLRRARSSLRDCVERKLGQ